MKKNILKSTRFSGIIASIMMLGMVLGLGSCSETIDDSNFAIKTEQTIMDYLTANPEFSGIKEIFERVPLGNREEASSLSSVLSSRGNYTLFVPDNEALTTYMLSVAGTEKVSELTDEQAQLIANSCVIDNGDEAAYEVADFPENGAFGYQNLNNRSLSCEQRGDEYFIGTSSKVTRFDIEVSNGMIHVVDAVIAPSSDKVPDLIGQADNMKIFSHLLTVTTWADSLSVSDRDEVYESIDHGETYTQSGTGGPYYIPAYRKIGFTALVETDDVYEREWGITLTKDAETGEVTNWDEVMQIIQNKCQAVYGTAQSGDLKHYDNAVNRFVAYHLLYGGIAYNNLVQHFNEFNYKFGDMKNPQTVNCPTNVWDYYTTLGRYRGLVKITQVGDAGFEHDQDHSMYANRISVYDNSRSGDYHETGVKDAGLKIEAVNKTDDGATYDNNAQNGYYYPINKILLYSDAVRDMLGAERIRIDVVTMMPEMLTNNVRGGNKYTYFPSGYLENLFDESSGTNFLYLSVAGAGGGGWSDYQGDEMLITGLYDFKLRLPPVPKDGTYEIRMGTAMNSLRGMVQIYFGSSPQKLSPAGLPFDQRQSVTNNPAIPWEADTEDDLVNLEVDKNLRNQGYMKAPNYFTVTDGTAGTTVRKRNDGWPCIRRIVLITEMKANETYYMRFKSALKKLDSQFFLDYFEFVPKDIYSGAEPEDIW